MKSIKMSFENLNFLLPIPDDLEGQAAEFITMADAVPIAITLNGEKFVLMKEDNFDELLELDDSDKEDICDDCADFFTFDEEDFGDLTVSVMIDLLEDARLNTRQLTHLEEVVSAHNLLAAAREIYGGDEE